MVLSYGYCSHRGSFYQSTVFQSFISISLWLFFGVCGCANAGVRALCLLVSIRMLGPIVDIIGSDERW